MPIFIGCGFGLWLWTSACHLSNKNHPTSLRAQRMMYPIYMTHFAEIHVSSAFSVLHVLPNIAKKLNRQYFTTIHADSTEASQVWNTPYTGPTYMYKSPFIPFALRLLLVFGMQVVHADDVPLTRMLNFKASKHVQNVTLTRLRNVNTAWIFVWWPIST